MERQHHMVSLGGKELTAVTPHAETCAVNTTVEELCLEQARYCPRARYTTTRLAVSSLSVRWVDAEAPRTMQKEHQSSSPERARRTQHWPWHK